MAAEIVTRAHASLVPVLIRIKARIPNEKRYLSGENGREAYIFGGSEREKSPSSSYVSDFRLLK